MWYARCMNPIASVLDNHRVLVLDGALATELERRGYDLKNDLWSAKILLEQPDAIRQLHYDYFKAGADCAITASYQATIEGFKKNGLSGKEAIALLQRSVHLARDAQTEYWADGANHNDRSIPFVAASIGPYGAFLADGSEYRGNYGLSEKDLMDFHRPRMRALMEAHPDILAFETIPSLIEAQALSKLLHEFPATAAWLSFSARDEKHIAEGQLFADCVRLLNNNPQIAAIGINCTSPQYISSLIHAGKKKTEKPILVYPNLGEQYDATAHDWNGKPAVQSFSEEAKTWFQAGAQLIGGCCRTSPTDIHKIAEWARGKHSFN